MAQKSNTGIIVGVISVLVVGTTLYLIIKGLKKQQNQPPIIIPPQGGKGQEEKSKAETEGKTETKNNPNFLKDFLSQLTTKAQQRGVDSKTDPTVAFTDFTFPIRKGQKGENVKKLQQLILSLNSKALPKYKDDGDFGTETASALLKMIGKESIDNQADIDKLKRYNYELMSKVAINLSLGLPLYK